MAWDSSTAGFTQYTPETSSATRVGDVWDGRCFAVPSPGNTYHIFLRDTNRAILMNNEGGAYIYDIDEDIIENNAWLCVEKNGYFGFTQKGQYLGHNMFDHIHARAGVLMNWESFVVRKHHEGGYQLLMPHWWFALKTVCADEGSGLVLRDHGDTTWEFVKVENKP